MDKSLSYLPQKNQERNNSRKFEGSGLSLDVTRSTSETSSSEMFPYHLAAGRSGVASSSKQHTATAVGGQLYLDTEKAGGNKRLGSFSSTHSPSDLAIKRSRMDIQPRSFAHTVQTIKMAVIKESFPLAQLSMNEVDLILQEILKRIDMIPVGEELPKIHGSNLAAGALIIQCEDAATRDWVKATFHGNAQVLDSQEALKVVSANELPRPVKVAFKTKDMITKEPNVLLHRLNRLNPELKFVKWRVLNRLVEPPFSRWIFMVDSESAAAIRRANFSAYTGLDQGVFKILHDPNQVSQNKDVVEEAK